MRLVGFNEIIILKCKVSWKHNEIEPMKIDHEYLKGLLEAFQAAEGPYTTIDELRENGYPYNDKAFTFHMSILTDEGMIEGNGTGKSTVGMERALSGEVIWIHGIKMRLTAAGHEYIDSLNEPQVWSVIQENFKDMSLETIKTVAKDLAVGFARRKMKDFIRNPE